VLFQKAITVPADTKETAKTHETLRTSVGMLDRIWIKFAAGCHFMVNIQILHHGTPLAPSEHDQSLVGDDQEFQGTYNTEIKPGYEDLDIYAWSPDTENQHKITVTVNVFTASEYSRMETQMEKLNAVMIALAKYLGMKFD
jgi:hypothetical protein